MNNFLEAFKKSVNGFLFQSSVLPLWIYQNTFLLRFPIVVGFKEIFVFLWKINSVLLNNRGRHCQYNFYRIIYETILKQWITASWKWKWRKLVFSMNFYGICDKIQSLDNITQKISSSWFFPPSVFFFISIIWIGLWFPRKLRK